MKELTVEEHVALLKEIGRLLPSASHGIFPETGPAVDAVKAIRTLIYERTGLEWEQKT